MSHSKPLRIRISDISLIGFCFSEKGIQKTFFHLKGNKKQKNQETKKNRETEKSRNKKEIKKK